MDCASNYSYLFVSVYEKGENTIHVCLPQVGASHLTWPNRSPAGGLWRVLHEVCLHDNDQAEEIVVAGSDVRSTLLAVAEPMAGSVEYPPVWCGYCVLWCSGEQETLPSSVMFSQTTKSQRQCLLTLTWWTFLQSCQGSLCKQLSLSSALSTGSSQIWWQGKEKIKCFSLLSGVSQVFICKLGASGSQAWVRETVPFSPGADQLLVAGDHGHQHLWLSL